jgi:16S rRNA A1518/A1519 N6-dimethyltransferase RsmA/KsgA/DIM1 with predicted DNA glycosylase/AP lyase activity
MSNLQQQVQNFLDTNHSDVTKDQFFCVDEDVLDKLIECANLSADDRVLEVGSGLGFLTQKIAASAKEVITIEIDERFKPFLRQLPGNVEIIYGDAYRLLNDDIFQSVHRSPTKTISSIPYSQAQNMLHNYTNYPWFQGDLIWLAPKSLAEKVNKEPILGAYFHAEIIMEVPRTSFYPQPNTQSAVIYFHRIPNPVGTGDFNIYLRRWFYNHEDIKVKNTLREGIISAAKNLKKKVVTKNLARELIDTLNLPQPELEKLTNNIRPEYYFELPLKLTPWFESLTT